MVIAKGAYKLLVILLLIQEGVIIDAIRFGIYICIVFNKIN